MTSSSNYTRIIERLLDRFEALTHSRAFRLLAALQPAFVVFTVIGVVIATFALWLDLSARQDERISRSWQTLSSNARGNSGKADALNFLAKACQDLRGMQLAPGSNDRGRMVDCKHRVFVPSLDLRGTRADNADLSCSDLDSGDADSGTARFDRASLNDTSWIRTKAERSSFRRASLIASDFRGARLGNADFIDAKLTETNFSYADLRGASFSAKSIVDGETVHNVTVHKADLRGVKGLTCEEFMRLDDWQSACRDPHLQCGAALASQCGPEAIPDSLRFRDPGDKQPAIDTQRTCTKIQREIAFRLDQVDRVMDGKFRIEDRNLSDSCARATTVFVIARLGGIARRPPPKHDETVWIGNAGYGYRHTPFKTGARSDEFASFSLPELVKDYMPCTSKSSSNAGVPPKLQSAVNEFEKATAVFQTRKCDRWSKSASGLWADVARIARKLAEIND